MNSRYYETNIVRVSSSPRSPPIPADLDPYTPLTRPAENNSTSYKPMEQLKLFRSENKGSQSSQQTSGPIQIPLTTPNDVILKDPRNPAKATSSSTETSNSNDKDTCQKRKQSSPDTSKNLSDLSKYHIPKISKTITESLLHVSKTSPEFSKSHDSRSNPEKSQNSSEISNPHNPETCNYDVSRPHSSDLTRFHSPKNTAVVFGPRNDLSRPNQISRAEAGPEVYSTSLAKTIKTTNRNMRRSRARKRNRIQQLNSVNSLLSLEIETPPSCLVMDTTHKDFSYANHYQLPNPNDLQTFHGQEPMSNPVSNTPPMNQEFTRQQRILLVPSYSTVNFIGRKCELKQMYNVLHADFSPTDPIDIAIVGQSGIGKSNLITRFIELNTDTFDHIIWHTYENNDKLLDCYITLAKLLNIKMNFDNMTNDMIQVLVSRVYDMLAQNKTLFIFDDVSDPSMLNLYLPKCHLPKPYSIFFIVSSIYTEWNSNYTIHLQPFSIVNINDFLSIHGVTLLTEDNLITIKNLTDGLPVLMPSALTLLKKAQSISRNNLIEIFIKEFKGEQGQNIYNEIIDDKKIQAIEKQLNVEISHCRIYNLLPYLDKNNLNLSFLSSLLILSNYVKELDLLVKHSVVKIMDNDKIIISNFMQESIKRNHIIQSVNHEYILNLLCLLDKNILIHSRYPTFKDEIYLIHSAYVWKENQLPDQLILNFSRMLVAIANGGKNYCEHYLFGQDFLSTIETVLSKQNYDYKQILSLIIAYTDSNYNEIILYLEQVLNETKEKDHIDVLRLYFHKANMLINLNDYSNAWDILLSIYFKQKVAIGSDHNDTIDTLIKMTLVASKTNDNYIIDNCLTHLYTRYNNPNLDPVKSLSSLKYIPKYLIDCNKIKEGLSLFDELQKVLVNEYPEYKSMLYECLIAKAECLSGLLKSYDEAWILITYIQSLELVNENSKLITMLCDIVTKMPEKISKEHWYTVIMLINKRIEEKRDFDKTFSLLSDLVFTYKQRVDAFELIKKFYLSLNSPASQICQKTAILKAECLILDQNFASAWLELKTLQKFQMDANFDFIETLALMCDLACKMQAPEYLNEWFEIMNSIEDFEKCLLIMEKVASFKSSNSSKAIEYYDRFCIHLNSKYGENSPPVLRTILTKSWHLWCLNQTDQAWKLYTDICEIVNIEPELFSLNLSSFNLTLRKILKIIKGYRIN